MQMTKTNKIILSAVAVVVLLAAYIFIDRRSKETDSLNNDEVNATTTTSTNGTVIKTEGSGGYTIEQVPLNEGVSQPKPIPDLNRQLTLFPGAIISPEARAVAVEKIKLIQDLLKKDSLSFSNWIDLGIYQKMAGDYEGAVLSWKYAGKLVPNNYTVFGNLGDLYANFIKDNGQAEMYYKEAIRVGPMQVYLYTQLADVYRYIFNDLEKAKAIVEQGLSKVPNDPNLLQLKASLN